MRKLLFSLALLLLAGIGYQHANTPKAQIERASLSTVRLLVEGTNSGGTGFVVDMKDTTEGCFITVATARHVVRDTFWEEVRQLRLDDPFGPLSAWVRWHPGADAGIAVFITEGECAVQPYKPVVLADYDVARGDYVFGMGFPVGQFYFNDGRVLQSTFWFDDLNTWVFSSNYPTYGGNSGGPMFDKHGRVVGILIGGYPVFPNITFATPIKYLKELLP